MPNCVDIVKLLPDARLQHGSHSKARQREIRECADYCHVWSHFKRGNNQHIHEPHVDQLVTTKVQAAVMTKAKANVHRPRSV